MRNVAELQSAVEHAYEFDLIESFAKNETPFNGRLGQ